MTPDIATELQTISRQHVDNLLGNVFAELDKLKADIREHSATRPDPDILINGIEPFTYFEFLAVACYRLRGTWKRAGEALKTLERRRSEWNTVISAALVHARNDLAAMEKGSAAYDEQVERIMKLVELLAMTFRPVAGPNAQWVGVLAATIGTGPQ